MKNFMSKHITLLIFILALLIPGGFLLATAPAPVKLSSLTLSPNIVINSTSSVGMITLSAPAPAGGKTISLSASPSVLVTIPATVKIRAGATSTTFNIKTKKVVSSKKITIAARLSGVRKTVTLTINPTPKKVETVVTPLTEKPVVIKPDAIITSSSCVMINDGGTPGHPYAPKGHRFFKTYGITTSGTMTGPVGTRFKFGSSPTIISTSLKNPAILTCGDWGKNCTRTASSSETSSWSYVNNGIPGEVVNVGNSPDNIQVIIKATAGINYSQLYEDPTYTKTFTVQCPLATY